MAAYASGLQVVRHQSKFGSWETISRDPDPRLRPHVLEYQGGASGWRTSRRDAQGTHFRVGKPRSGIAD
jgi:hypothetical protein